MTFAKLDDDYNPLIYMIDPKCHADRHKTKTAASIFEIFPLKRSENGANRN